MSPLWNVIYIGAFLFNFIAIAHSYASEEVEDLIEIFETNGEIVAIVEGRKSVVLRLSPKEDVQWSSAKGNLGALLTDRHFFVVSTSSHNWNALPLGSGNEKQRLPVLSPNIALLVDGNNVFGFNTTSNRFIRIVVPLYDEFVSVEAEKHIAVVVTTSKAYGFSAGGSQFSETRLGPREIVKEVKVTASTVTIHTSHRILSLRDGDPNWKEHRL